ncbi:MAG: excinuclease ABC subunit UvrC [Deltaproteobacteria bacterium]|nr:excinuclease ABC subunit UvrC [Deltaproteobacteria bacterium]
MPRSLLSQLQTIPHQAGVYLFKDPDGTVLYVGKAADLRARVRQYLGGTDERAMVPLLVEESAAVEVVVTRTEREALLLENTLIKRYQPRFNVRLRDDSQFLHLRVHSGEPWPRFTLVREIQQDGARYFGPFTSAAEARSTLAFIQRAFPLRSCTDEVLRSRTRACLLHQIGRCPAPCVGAVTEADYRRSVEEALLVVEGKDLELLAQLERRMGEAAAAEAYEEAARLRDLIRAVRTASEDQLAMDSRLGERDAWGLHQEGDAVMVAMLPVRRGALGEVQVELAEGRGGTAAEILSSVINAAYTAPADIPPEVLLSHEPDDIEALAEVLSERRGAPVQLKVPRRGAKVRLVDLARENARVRFGGVKSEDERHAAAMRRLGALLGLPGPPGRMEAFDNSNLEGTDAVAAMSVFLGGRPARREYRRYKVKTVVGADDYASMREILTRRIRRLVAEGALPDLWVIDGGAGQLGVAVQVLAEEGVALPVIGLAKARTEKRRGETGVTDKIVLPGRDEPLRLPPGDPALRILQHLRDEVHKHAITYHRQVRGKRSLVSALEGIPGVGAARRKALLLHLGSARAVAGADVATLAEVPGIGPALAQVIHQALRR